MVTKVGDPITKESIMLENNWSWNTTKWPWEGMK